MSSAMCTFLVLVACLSCEPQKHSNREPGQFDAGQVATGQVATGKVASGQTVESDTRQVQGRQRSEVDTPQDSKGGAAQFPDSDARKFLTEQGKLANKLVITDAQSGAVGRTGYETVIEPNGDWSRFQFWGAKRRKLLGRGQLTTDQVKDLARILADERFSEMPPEFGKTDATSNPNPHYVVVTFGEERTELMLPPLTNMSQFVAVAEERDQGHVRRLENLVRSVEKLFDGNPREIQEARPASANSKKP